MCVAVKGGAHFLFFYAAWPKVSASGAFLFMSFKKGQHADKAGKGVMA